MAAVGIIVLGYSSGVSLRMETQGLESAFNNGQLLLGSGQLGLGCGYYLWLGFVDKVGVVEASRLKIEFLLLGDRPPSGVCSPRPPHPRPPRGE